jgi:hypothetical protein
LVVLVVMGFITICLLRDSILGLDDDFDPEDELDG